MKSLLHALHQLRNGKIDSCLVNGLSYESIFVLDQFTHPVYLAPKSFWQTKIETLIVYLIDHETCDDAITSATIPIVWQERLYLVQPIKSNPIDAIEVAYAYLVNLPKWSHDIQRTIDLHYGVEKQNTSTDHARKYIYQTLIPLAQTIIRFYLDKLRKRKSAISLTDRRRLRKYKSQLGIDWL